MCLILRLFYLIFKDLFKTNNFGGAKRDRTADLLLAKQALSQLSYNPIYMVGLNGLEPSTSRFSRRDTLLRLNPNHLSCLKCFPSCD